MVPPRVWVAGQPHFKDAEGDWQFAPLLCYLDSKNQIHAPPLFHESSIIRRPCEAETGPLINSELAPFLTKRAVSTGCSCPLTRTMLVALSCWPLFPASCPAPSITLGPSENHLKPMTISGTPQLSLVLFHSTSPRSWALPCFQVIVTVWR
jgi:hypothetical protein